MSPLRPIRRLAVAALAASALACLPLPPAGVILVDHRPPPDRYEDRDHRPGLEFVWIWGYWGWDRDDFYWVPGRWTRPERPHREWVRGHWVHSRRGWYWVDGHWR